ncbi:MAG: phospholipase/carboxylesterase [Woeseiaceae bacterium]|jgi:phospholipase/carboxylesterase
MTVAQYLLQDCHWRKHPKWFCSRVPASIFYARQFYRVSGEDSSTTILPNRIDPMLLKSAAIKRSYVMQAPQTVEVAATGDAEGSVIWLHGLGADGHDFEAIIPELRLAGALQLRFVFPHAPVRAVTINNGMSMRAWYDILSLDRGGPQDEAGVRESSELLLQLIENEHERGIPYEKITIAGFSQGGAIALHTALRFPQRLAGVMALSTYLPLQSKFEAEVATNTEAQDRDLPVFFAHGSFDPVLPMVLGEKSMTRIKTAGYRVEWHEYPMAHALCAQEITDIRSWLLSVYK